MDNFALILLGTCFSTDVEKHYRVVRYGVLHKCLFQVIKKHNIKSFKYVLHFDTLNLKSKTSYQKKIVVLGYGYE